MLTRVLTPASLRGRRRTSHLIATPYADGLALLGTSFGQAATPAWAQPRGRPARDRDLPWLTREVLARAASATEAAEVFELAGRCCPGYAHYRRRVGESRRIQVFVLVRA